MKTLITILIGLITFCNLNAHAQTVPAVREQLEVLNKYWKPVAYDNPILENRTQLATDVDLITTHLSLVEDYLRSKQVNLSETQLRNRNLCLDILKEYRERGVYPVNSYHSKRTPYFIDNYGTACAVGQLIISTGYETLAKRISSENNYAYIEDLKYSELFAWADTYGFTIDELEWIQPTYPCISPACPNDSVRNVSCYAGGDGCVGYPTPTLSSPPFFYQFFIFDSSSNTWYILDYPCDLTVGTYKWKITGGDGSIEEVIRYVEQPDSIAMSANTVNDNGSCNGSIAASFSGGTPPYHVSWNTGDTLTNISGLCEGTYTISITDSNNCNKAFNVAVELSSGLTNVNSENLLMVFPNPAGEHISISSKIPDSENLTVVIYDYIGRTVISTTLPSANLLDISLLQDGVYVLKVGNSYQRFIKNSR